MRPVTLAKKDLTLLLRQKASLFFTFVWPFMIAIMFGVIFSGGGGESSKPSVAVVDLDQSPASAEWIAELAKLEELSTDNQASADDARELVRTRKRTAAIVVPAGFAETSKTMFYGESPQVLLMIDPSRKAEEAMIKGMLQGMGGELMFKKLSDPQASQQWISDSLQQAEQVEGESGEKLKDMLGSIEQFMQTQQSQPSEAADSEEAPQWQPLKVADEPVQRKRSGPSNAFSITFPQGMLWAIIGCIMTFASSLVLERVNGTFLRLRSSPMAQWEVMAGKALACFAAIFAVTVALAIVARFGFDVQPNSWMLLGLAVVCTAIGFTGLMMLISALGTTVSSVSGSGWAILMPLMMLGGGMIPLFMMPAWMNSISAISPVKWAVLALEGAIWREFSMAEMILPCAILLAVGALCFSAGTTLYARRGL